MPISALIIIILSLRFCIDFKTIIKSIFISILLNIIIKSNIINKTIIKKQKKYYIYVIYIIIL